MDKDFIIWLLTVICISWLIMLTVYAFKLKRGLECQRFNDSKNARYICDLRSDIHNIYVRVHKLEEAARPESLAGLHKLIDNLREKSDSCLNVGESAMSEFYLTLIDDINAFIDNHYGEENEH